MKEFFNKPDLGLLILRIGMGAMMIAHGATKFMGGEAKLEKVGSAMEVFGLDFAPLMWGVMAAGAQVLGGLFVMLGTWFRPACALILSVMLVAMLNKFVAGKDFMSEISHAAKTGLVFLSLMFIGAGRFKVGKK